MQIFIINFIVAVLTTDKLCQNDYVKLKDCSHWVQHEVDLSGADTCGHARVSLCLFTL